VDTVVEAMICWLVVGSFWTVASPREFFRQSSDRTSAASITQLVAKQIGDEEELRMGERFHNAAIRHQLHEIEPVAAF